MALDHKKTGQYGYPPPFIIVFMDTKELNSLFTEALKQKLLGTKYNDRIINDVQVEISKEYWQDEYVGGEFDKIEIKVKTLSPKGKNSKWVFFHL